MGRGFHRQIYSWSSRASTNLDPLLSYLDSRRGRKNVVVIKTQQELKPAETVVSETQHLKLSLRIVVSKNSSHISTALHTRLYRDTAFFSSLNVDS